ncbi:ATP-dependent Clp protease proteolytic subunit [Falsirhodobacter sp. 1013]|uniref:ATP-dependent Clp protease proteolytic subunit n=1 Tax=Falsirhodobacter sp. 1013 TaxID=3417566 RepID=UPI003EC0F24E
MMRGLSTPHGAMKAVLVAQMVIGGALVAIDLRGTPQAAAPGLFAPPAEGPSVRPYRPDLRPGGPGTPAMRPMPEQLLFEAEGETIRITGQIARGDADRFVAWLDKTRPDTATVTLDSSGGSVSDALAIGRTIRAAGYATTIAGGAVCMSACPYLFAGGTERTVAEGGVVGVHQSYFGENTLLPAFMAVKDVQRGQAAVLDYLTEMGVDLRLMGQALKTPPEEINILTPEQMTDFKLTT